MKISIEQGQSGWDSYVLNGTKNKPRDKSKIYILDGDTQLGNALCENNKYADKYYRIVLAFKGKPIDEIMKEAYQEFKENFFIGFDEDEYHTDAVIHKDTDNYHIHIRVPKQNLLTNTELQLYMHSIDMKRKDLLQDYLSYKYEPGIDQGNKYLFREDKKIDRINKQRSERKQPEFTLTKTKGKKEAEKKINEYMSEMIYAGLINNQDELKKAVKSLGVEIVNDGYDRKRDFHYFTIENDTGKMRIKGNIYADEFFRITREYRQQQIATNRSLARDQRANNTDVQEIKRELRKENEKRFNKVSNLFRKARERARTDIKAVNHKAIDNSKSENTINRDSIKSITGLNGGSVDIGIHTEISRVDSMASAEINETYRARRNEIHNERQSDTRDRQTDNIHQDGGKIDDSIRTAMERRNRERERIFQEVRNPIIFESRSIQPELIRIETGIREELVRSKDRVSGYPESDEKIVRDFIEQGYKPLYEEARGVVQERQRRRTIRERVGETISRFGKQLERFTRGIRNRLFAAGGKLAEDEEQSSDLRRNVREYKEQIEKDNEPDYDYPMIKM